MVILSFSVGDTDFAAELGGNAAAEERGSLQSTFVSVWLCCDFPDVAPLNLFARQLADVTPHRIAEETRPFRAQIDNTLRKALRFVCGARISRKMLPGREFAGLRLQPRQSGFGTPKIWTMFFEARRFRIMVSLWPAGTKIQRKCEIQALPAFLARTKSPKSADEAEQQSFSHGNQRGFELC